jgi:site-specific recombinase XerD
MNQQLIQSYVEYLKEKGYSRQTVHAYSKALEQASDTWNTHNIKPVSSLLFLMVSGTTIKE